MTRQIRFPLRLTRSTLLGILLCVGLVVMGPLCCTRVDAAHMGVHINYSGHYRGVEDVPVVTGWVFYVPLLSTVLEYPTAIQSVVWSKSPDEGNPINEEITFTNADQVTISCDVSVGFHVEPEKVPHFYLKFRSDLSTNGDVTQWADGYFHNVARDAFNERAGDFHIEDIMGNNGKFIAEVRKALQDQVQPYGVAIDQFGLIGACRPPANVLDAINQKVQAQQVAVQKQNELAQSQADAAKLVARATGEANAAIAAAEGDAKAAITRAEGDARANTLLGNSITPNVLAWTRLQIQGKWNGVLPTVTGGAIPMITVPKLGGGS